MKPLPFEATPAESTATPLGTSLPERVVTVPLIEEHLHVEKRVVDRGGWRLTKQVGSRTETVDEWLAEGQVSIERRPVGRLLDAAVVPVQREEGDVLVLPVVKEVLVTEKRLMLVEEIRITRLATRRRDTREFELRSEAITVERLAPLEPIQPQDDSEHPPPSLVED